MGNRTTRGRKLAAVCATFVVGGAMLGIATPANAVSEGTGGSGPVGGWSETQGNDRAGLGIFATVNHVGKAETKTISGTSNKRAHGWTTWAGTAHYTTAQLEHYWPNSGVIATSGRKYGTGGTEAISPWKAFNPNASSSGFGQARTYYGR